MRGLQMTRAAAVVAALWLATPALADDCKKGEGKDCPATLTLQAAASSQLVQDSVVITLAHEAEAADQALVATQLTEHLNQALTKAGKPTGIRIRQGAWRVWPITDRQNKMTGWRGRVEIVLQSKDIPAAAALAAQLAPGMTIASVAFDLSTEARAAEEQRLLQQAALAFKQRAADAARAFGFADFQIRSLNLDGSGLMVMPRNEGMMLRVASAPMADAAPPQLEPGETTVSLEVRGEVVLLTKAKSEHQR